MTQSVAPPAAAPTTRPRLFFIDNLRVLLTVLVVLHHAALTYGNIPLWFYTEPAQDPSGGLLDALVGLNQSFFMGAFFLVSGFFVPGSFDRKGVRTAFADRLKRLGIPLLLFLLVLRPLVNFGAYPEWREALAPQGVDLSYGLYYVLSWDPGPMWFVEVLLVFTGVYALWRRFGPSRNRPVPEPAPATGRAPSVRAIVLFTAGLAVATYLWRIAVPINSYVPFLGLPTPAHLPQYASLFAVGLLAARRGWLEHLSRTTGRVALAVAAVAAVASIPLYAVTGDAGMGHGTWQSLLHATWESVFAVSIILGLLVLFRERCNRQGERGRFLSTHAYTVYVIHPLVLVGLGYAFSGLEAVAVAKFAVVAAVAVPLCWALAALVRTLPGAKKIL